MASSSPRPTNDNISRLIGKEKAALFKHVYMSTVISNSVPQVSAVLPRIKSSSHPFGAGSHWLALVNFGNKIGANLEDMEREKNLPGVSPLHDAEFVQWEILPASINTSLTLNKFEQVLSKNEAGAFKDVLSAFMIGACGIINNTAAFHLWGDQWGTAFKVTAAQAGTHSGTFSIDVSNHLMHVLSIGTRLVRAQGGVNGIVDPQEVYEVVGFTKGQDPSSGMRKLSMTLRAVNPLAWQVGDCLQLRYMRKNYGVVDGGDEAYGMYGFPEFVGVNHSAGNPIFCGVDRSQWPQSTLGSIVQQSSGMKIADVVLQALVNASDYGADNDLEIVMSKNSYLAMGQEMKLKGIDMNLWQSVITGGKEKLNATVGMGTTSMQFASMFIGRISIDPTIPDGMAAVVPMNDTFINSALDISGIINAVQNPGENGEIGTFNPSAVSIPNYGNEKLVSGITWDDVFAVTGTKYSGNSVASDLVITGIQNLYVSNPPRSAIGFFNVNVASPATSP